MGVHRKALMLLALCPLFSCGKAKALDETRRLAEILGWPEGAMVADVGAGGGKMARAAAEIVGRSGTVFATEIGRSKVERLRKRLRSQANIRVLEGLENSTGLPKSCCEFIYLRGVYHHIKEPSTFNASLKEALRPGGRLAIIDFPPKRFLTWFFPVRGVPANRGGHGIPVEVVVQELRDAGFEIEQRLPHWPGGQYVVVARKPG